MPKQLNLVRQDKREDILPAGAICFSCHRETYPQAGAIPKPERGNRNRLQIYSHEVVKMALNIRRRIGIVWLFCPHCREKIHIPLYRNPKTMGKKKRMEK